MFIRPSAHTNPVFLIVKNSPIRANRFSAEWCLRCVEQCWKSKAHTYRTDERTGVWLESRPREAIQFTPGAKHQHPAHAVAGAGAGESINSISPSGCSRIAKLRIKITNRKIYSQYIYILRYNTLNCFFYPRLSNLIPQLPGDVLCQQVGF